MGRLVLFAALLSGCSCSSFTEVADAGRPDVDLSVADGAPPPGDVTPDRTDLPKTDGPPDQTLVDAPLSDAPVVSCRTIPLPCLSSTPSTVIEVPSEATTSQAFAQAKAGDTIQIKGGSLGYGWKIPPFVTLRGCAGAQIAGNVVFVGSGGTVEGFEVPGEVIANRTGAYTIRENRFTGNGTTYGVSASAADSLVSATVTVVVEENWFEQRAHGIEARTYYDTLTHAVEITIRNNIFAGVDKPVSISEAGLVGKITATIEDNTRCGR
jgi:hypothetical protein